jgi:RHS repeat-associated protein
MEMTGPWQKDPLPEATDPKMNYRYNGKEYNFAGGLGWLDYGARWFDPVIGRFNCVDPIAEDFAHVSTFNYAENEPVGSIDLWGLQKAKPDFFRAEGHVGITAGETGFEVKAAGAKVGVIAKLGSRDVLGVSTNLGDRSGPSANVTVYGNDNKETYGVSGGRLLGGEISITTNTKTKELEQNTQVNLGIFYIKNEFTKDEKGNTDNNQYLGVELGVSAGFIFGFDASFSSEINVSRREAPDGYVPEEKPTFVPQDNTHTELYIPEVKPKDENKS